MIRSQKLDIYIFMFYKVIICTVAPLYGILLRDFNAQISKTLTIVNSLQMKQNIIVIHLLSVLYILARTKAS